jgi:ubiquinone/menaquinone biosynthesis C-methylase UbiE
MSDIGFRMMAFTFKIRDFFRPRRDIVKEVGMKEGFNVFDYGCGAGSYVPTVAELVGKSGKIYALDINQLAIKMVKKIATKKHVLNVETILSDCDTGLQDDSLEVVLLYDTLHDLEDQNRMLKELHRVLKPNGILSVSDHHIEENEILSKVTKNGLFSLLRKGERTYSFAKNKTV